MNMIKYCIEIDFILLKRLYDEHLTIYLKHLNNRTKMVWRNYLWFHLLTLKSQQCTWQPEEVRPLASEFITRVATKMIKEIADCYLVQSIMWKLCEELPLSIRNRVLNHSALNLPHAFWLLSPGTVGNWFL